MVDIIKWHKDQGGHGAKLSDHALRLLHETVELCVASGADINEIIYVVLEECQTALNKHEFGGSPENIPQELADVSFLQEILAHYANINTEQAREDKFKILLERQWEADDSGVLWRPETR